MPCHAKLQATGWGRSSPNDDIVKGGGRWGKVGVEYKIRRGGGGGGGGWGGSTPGMGRGKAPPTPGITGMAIYTPCLPYNVASRYSAMGDRLHACHVTRKTSAHACLKMLGRER